MQQSLCAEAVAWLQQAWSEAANNLGAQYHVEAQSHLVKTHFGRRPFPVAMEDSIISAMMMRHLLHHVC